MTQWHKCCAGCDMNRFCLYQQTDDIKGCEYYWDYEE